MLLELEMISFLPITLKIFFRAGFAHHLRMFSRFFPFVKSGNKCKWHFSVPQYYQEIVFDQCRLYSN